MHKTLASSVRSAMFLFLSPIKWAEEITVATVAINILGPTAQKQIAGTECSIDQSLYSVHGTLPLIVAAKGYQVVEY
jgi:hypothetical protein